MSQKRRHSVIASEEPLTMDMTQRHALFALYAIQEWECIPPRDDPYAPGIFYNKIPGILHGLENVSRQTVFRHLKTAVCLICDTPVDLERSRLDHIMPRQDGGPDDPSNSLILCRSHNSSKGAKDLLEWWLFKGFKVADLPRNILCLYARIYWQHLSPERLSNLCHEAARTFLIERMASLPSDPHRIALIGSTYAGCAFTHWLKG